MTSNIEVMEPIAVALDMLQEDHKACQGYVALTLISMCFHISSLECSSNPLLQEFKTNALAVLHKRFDKYMEITFANRDILLAAISHPNFKISFVQNESDNRHLQEFLRDECEQNLNVEPATGSIAQEVQTNSFFVSFSRPTTSNYNAEQDIDREIERYLNDARVDEKMLIDYPNIKKVFFKFNTTLSSSEPIERVFSQSKLIFRPQRNRLNAENFERALF